MAHEFHAADKLNGTAPSYAYDEGNFCHAYDENFTCITLMVVTLLCFIELMMKFAQPRMIVMGFKSVQNKFVLSSSSRQRCSTKE